MAAPPPPARLHGFAWWRSLGSPQLVAAPMVDASELAFRVLVREHGAQLAVTPMLHARMCLEQPGYLQANFTTHDADRPLLAQFCGSDAEVLLRAARLVEARVDGIDLNVGCPQGIARRGHYGAFLLEEPQLLVAIVARLHAELSVPVSCKVRLLPAAGSGTGGGGGASDLAATIALCRALEAAGCSLLTVHGRTRHNMKQTITAADWDAIREVRRAVGIPVVANGSIGCFADLGACLRYTGCAGVMASEALLENPGLFSDNVPMSGPLRLRRIRARDQPPAIHGGTEEAASGSSADVASEASADATVEVPRSSQFALTYRYLQLAEEHAAGWASVKPHVFKQLFGVLRVCPDLRTRLGARVESYGELRNIVEQLEARHVAVLGRGGVAGAAAAAELARLRAQVATARAASPGCAWSEPEYLLDPSFGGAWYMRYRPDAYGGRKAPLASAEAVTSAGSGAGAGVAGTGTGACAGGGDAGVDKGAGTDAVVGGGAATAPGRKRARGGGSGEGGNEGEGESDRVA